MTFTDKIRHHQLLKLITGEHELINGVNLNIFSLPTAAWSGEREREHTHTHTQ